MNNKPADVPFCGVRKDKILSAAPTLDPMNLKHLRDFIVTRYKIHYRKDVLKLPAPWTANPVLSRYRFTNVRREHDKESKWLIQHIAENPSLCYEDKLLNCVLFRTYNKHETAELLGLPIEFSVYKTKKGTRWDPEPYRSRFQEALDRDPHRVFFTGAFITGGLKRALAWYLPDESTKSDTPEMRVLWFMRHLASGTFVKRVQACKDQQQVFKLLAGLMGIGDFLGYQIFVDFTYIPEFPFSENEFVIAGPGCKRGLDYIFKDRAGMTYEECLFWLRDNINLAWEEYLGSDKKVPFKLLMKDIPEQDRYMNVMSLENCMCELSKYIRAVNNEGRPRQIYVARRT